MIYKLKNWLTGQLIAEGEAESFPAFVVAHKAKLRGAKLEGAYLSGAYLSGADLSRADLRGADLSGAKVGEVIAYEDVQLIANLHSLVAEAVGAAGENLEMGTWHSCETTHCRAGHAIRLAGEAGYKLEQACGPSLAGALLYHRAYPYEPIPDFYAPNQDALADILQCAASERAQS